jgi:uncharacterized protein
VGQHRGTIMNLVDGQAAAAQKAMLGMVREEPQKTLREAAKLTVPRHHDVRAKDVDLKRLGAILAVAYERELQDFASLLLLENLGPRTLQSLALRETTFAKFWKPSKNSPAYDRREIINHCAHVCQTLRH